MGPRVRLFPATMVTAALVAGSLGVPAAAEEPVVPPAPTVTCQVTTPGNPLPAIMDTPIEGKVTCAHSAGLPVTYAAAPFVVNVTGPAVGRLALDPANGNFRYEPGWYPPDPVTGKQVDPLPEYTGVDNFTIIGTASDGTQGSIVVDVTISSPPRVCKPDFVPQTRTMFNDPAGKAADQYQMLRYLVDMIDCTPATNPDGTQASIKFSFYSLTYAPVQAALSGAAQRGVSVQALTNSHADKYGSWQQLANDLGPDTSAVNYAITCWQGCLTPRTPPPADGPTAWYAADSESLVSNVVTFRDRSLQGAAPIASWHWDFGDGSSADGPGPHVHDYGIAGTYLTSLTVTDTVGLTHTMTGSKTLPDNLEPMYPSMHSKFYLFSTVGTGANARQWVSAYSSGNPTYHQSRKGFNNLNVAVGDKTLYTIFRQYYGDLLAGSRGQLITPNYFRTFYTPGNAQTKAKATTVHLLPQTSGDINREILKSIQCRYKVGKKLKRTRIRVSMFVLTRRGIGAELWKLAMREGCRIEIVYTQMSQRLRGADGNWIASSDGEPIGYGAADCLATPPTRVVVKPARKGRPARRVIRMNNLKGPDGRCSGGELGGYVPVTSTGVWLNRTSPITGGSLTVRMACPVQPVFDPVHKLWSVQCINSDIYTHHKVMLVRGHIRGKRQKYVMTGSANWSSPGLRASDEIVTEIAKAPVIFAEYLANYNYLKSVVAENSIRAANQSVKTFMLKLSGNQQLDVRGMNAADLEE